MALEGEEAATEKGPLTEAERLVRKLRKKLRQIEHLETLGRDLNEEESSKVEAKQGLRLQLEQALKAMKRKSEDKGTAERGVEVKRRRSPSGEGSSNGPLVAEGLGKEQQLEVSVLQDEEPSSSTSAATGEQTCSSPASDVVQVKVSTLAPQKRKKTKKGRGSSSDPSRWSVYVSDLLPQHEDLALAADADAARDVVVTAGRDTTVLAWKLSRPEEQVSSLRGHTGAVTCVKILPEEANGRLGLKSGAVVAVSGSLDCSLKVWDVLEGTMVKSIYTYNGIRCLSLTPSSSEEMIAVVTGTDGGKVELFDLAGSRGIRSVTAHDDVVTAVDCRGGRTVSASRDGIIKVWEGPLARKGGGKEAYWRCLFASEDVRPAAEDQEAHFRCVLSAR